MNRKSDKTNRYLVRNSIVITAIALGIVEALVFILIFSKWDSSENELSEGELSWLRDKACRLMREVISLDREVDSLSTVDPEQAPKRKRLFQEAHEKFVKALDVAEQIDRYYEEQGLISPKWQVFLLHLRSSPLYDEPHYYIVEPVNDG